MRVIASLPQGLEEEGAKELQELGAYSIKASRRYVSCEVDLACFYRIYIQARLPFRILREVACFRCNSPTSLYHGIQNALEWYYWLNPSKSFRVDVSGRSEGLTHSHFTALQVKNAIVDLQRNLWGNRSDISVDNPDLVLHLHLRESEAILSLDGSSESLHKRGYRPAMGVAPLKENLAAGLIRMSQWDGQTPLVDPFCGSATLLIEAVKIACRVSPGLDRQFLFEHWPDFDRGIWNQEINMALKLISNSRQLPNVIGCEANHQIAENAGINIRSSNLNKYITLHNCSFDQLTLPKEKGLIVCNPPYGKRVGDSKQLSSFYRDFGLFCKSYASGWDLWLLSGNQELSKELKMKANRKIPISNGGIDCRWLHYKIH